MALWEFTHLNKHGNRRTRIVHSEGSLNISPKLGKFIIVKRFRYQHKDLLPPFIITTPTGTYLTPGWKKVDPNTTLEDVEWVTPNVKAKKTQVEKFEFTSSSSNKVYVAKRITDGDGNKKYTCNCFGSVRAKDGRCKHIKSITE